MNLFLLVALTLNAQTPDGLNINLPSGWSVKHNIGGQQWHLLLPPDLLRQDDGKAREFFFAGPLPSVRDVDDETLLSSLGNLPYFQRGVSKFTANTVLDLPGGRARMISFDKPAYAAEPSAAAALAVNLPKGGVYVLSVMTPEHVLYRRKKLLESIAGSISHETGGAAVDYDSVAIEGYRTRLAGTEVTAQTPERRLQLNLRANFTYDGVAEVPGAPILKDSGTWRLALQGGNLYLQLQHAGSWSIVPIQMNASTLTVHGAPARITPLTGEGLSPYQRNSSGLLFQKANGWEVLGEAGGFTLIMPPGWKNDNKEHYLAGVLLGARNISDPNITNILAGALPFFTVRPEGARKDTIATKTAERILLEGNVRIQDYTLERPDRKWAIRVYLRDLPKGGVAFLYAVGEAACINRQDALLERLTTLLRHESDGAPIGSDTPTLTALTRRLRDQKIEIPRKDSSPLTLDLLANGTFKSTVSMFMSRDAQASGSWKLLWQGPMQYLYLQDAFSGIIYTRPFEVAGTALKFDGQDAKLSPLASLR